jgi:hypothetical protein
MKMCAIVVGRDGEVFDLGAVEYPPPKRMGGIISLRLGKQSRKSYSSN